MTVILKFMKIIKYHMFDFETLVGKNQAVMKADKRFRLEQESGKLLQVLSVKGSATVDDVEMTAQGLSVEGVWMADVLYLSTEDMTPVMSSSYMEPFTFFVETKNLTGNEDYQLDGLTQKTEEEYVTRVSCRIDGACGGCR